MSLAASFLRAPVGSVPSHWKERRLRDLVRLVNGHPFPSESFGPEGDIPLVRIRDLLSQDFETYVSGNVPRSVILRDGDVIVGMDGDFNVAVWRRGSAALNQRLCLLRAREDVDMRFISYSLPSILKVINDLTFSTTVKHLASGDLLNERVALPPMEEQGRIADFLDLELSRMDDLAKSKERQIRLLNERAQTVLASTVSELFDEYGSIPLRRIWLGIEQGWSPQCEDVLAEPNTWAVLKTSAVSAGVFNALAHKRLPADIEPDLRYVIHDGDLLLTRGSGSPALVGVAAVADTGGRRLLLSDLLYKLRLQPAWPTSFVACVLRSRPVREQISLLLRGQSGQTIKLRGQDIGEIVVPLVPPGLRTSLAVEINSMQARHADAVQRISGGLRLMNERRQTLIAAAVTGQIDVTTARGVEV